MRSYKDLVEGKLYSILSAKKRHATYSLNDEEYPVVWFTDNSGFADDALFLFIKRFNQKFLMFYHNEKFVLMANGFARHLKSVEKRVSPQNYFD